MPLGSIPPVERGLAKGLASSRRGNSTRIRATTRFKTPTAFSIRQEPSQPKVVYPSIRDVKVLRTANRATWEFPYGEFDISIGDGEIHAEVKIGSFSDAWILKIVK